MRLAHLAAKCMGGSDDDLEFFLLEVRDMLGLQVADETGAKGVLAEIL